jgi:hypothetical protein
MGLDNNKTKCTNAKKFIFVFGKLFMFIASNNSLENNSLETLHVVFRPIPKHI